MSDFSNAAPSQLCPQSTSRFVAQNSIHNAQDRQTFAPRSWTCRALWAIQSTALFVSGVFLLTNITHTPGLEVQVALLGTLLIAGGFGMLSQLG